MAVRYRQCQTAQFSQYAWKCWEAQRIDIYTTVTRIASCQYSWPLSSLHRLLSQFITDWIGVLMRTTITQLLQVLSPCLFNGEDALLCHEPTLQMVYTRIFPYLPISISAHSRVTISHSHSLTQITHCLFPFSWDSIGKWEKGIPILGEHL